MTSNIKNYLSIVLALISTHALSSVIIYPTTGLELSATPQFSSDGLLTFKPTTDQTSAVQYRLTTFRVNGRDVDKSKLKIKTIYSSEFKSLDRYRLVLSGKENANPVKASFKFESSWYDIPGVYSGIISSDTNTSDFPIKVIVSPKTTLSLSPPNFTIATSESNLSVIREVDLIFGTNSPSWELYVAAEDLILGSSNKISNDRVFVRIKNDLNPQPWLVLGQPIKLISGAQTSPKKIATVEFFVDSQRLDRAGNYLGKIKFLVDNI